jgi:P-type conjugative transfer ATPase TrbB
VISRQQVTRVSLTPREAVAQREREALLAAMRPIEGLLNDERTVEIMLNADGSVWIDRIGAGMTRTEVRLTPADGERMLRNIAASVGRELNEDHPTLSCRLPHFGARVQGSIPPLVHAPVFALRKPASLAYSLADFVAQGVLTEQHAEALEREVHARQNILIGGGTGSGKTTFAAALLKVVASTSDRVLLIEDTPELQCQSENRLEFFLTDNFACRDAVRSAMRYRPDRIIVGELRDGGSALEFLKAANTGHPGSMATLHANDTRGMLERVCQLCEEVVIALARQRVAETINICVHLRRDPRARAGRSITSIDRVLGYAEGEGFLVESLT